MSWPLVEIGQVSEIFSGAGFPKKYQGKTKGEFPLAKVGDISRAKRDEGSTISTAENFVSSTTAKELRAAIFPTGSIVFAKIGEAIKKNNRCITTREMAFDNNVMGISFNQELVSRDYAFRFLDTLNFYELSNSTTVPSIRKGDIATIKIPLPPLEEQKRIAGILDQADALRRLRTRALEKLNTLGQAIFHEMFGDPILNERKWPSAEIGKTAIKISDGNYAEKYPKASDFVETGVPFIRANNIRNGTVMADDLRYISVKKHELLKKGHLQTGDVLITTRGKIGNLAVVPKQFYDANINAQLVLMRCVDKAVQPDFLYYQLSQQSFQIQFEKIQTGVALKQLPVGRLKQLSIILPPLNLQNDFAEKMQSILKQHEHFESVSQKFTSLFASLQDRAFRGEL
jgi:type I restriction enzyme S subunit